MLFNENIVIGKKYVIKWGSIQEQKTSNIHTLQYPFKPAMIDETVSGSLLIATNSEAVVSLRNTDGSTEKFRGNLFTSISGINNECLLEYNKKDDCFNLNRVTTSIVNLRQIRDDSRINKYSSSNNISKLNESSLKKLIGGNLHNKKRKSSTIISDQKQKQLQVTIEEKGKNILEEVQPLQQNNLENEK
eukprot:gene7218-9849_t